MSGCPVWARIGAECICIDDTPGVVDGPNVIRDQRYTISDVYWSGDSWCLSVAGIDAVYGFLASRFRPAVKSRSLEDDMALFTPLLSEGPSVTRLDVKLDMLNEAWRISRDGIDEIATNRDLP